MKSMNAELDYSVELVTTLCHLGGKRWWFICPLTRNGIPCGHRVRKLYQRGRYFGCRHCHDLTYRSTQESDSRVYAALRSGLDLGSFDNPNQLAVTQLALAFKVLTIEKKRLNRLDRRLNRDQRPP